MSNVLPQVVSLVAHAPERTIFTRFLTPASADEAGGTWRDYYRKWACVTGDVIDPRLFDLVPPLFRYVPPAMIFDKTTFSAFADGRLIRALVELNVTQIIISGAETDVCVLATVLAAVDAGFHAIVVRDAVCSSADESHDALLGLYTKRFDVQVSIASTTQILERWHPD